MKNKTNLLLILLLIASLGLCSFVAYRFIDSRRSLTVPDFLGKSKETAIEWCGSLDPNYSCEIQYEDSTSTEKDHIFYQSISAGNKMKDNLVLKVSTGLIAQIELPEINENTTREDIEAWELKNMMNNVKYVEEESQTVKRNRIIRIEHDSVITADSLITVYVSKGDPEKEKETIEIKAGEYTNLSVAQFENKAKELGLVPNHNTSRDSSSSSISEGRIVWHGSGTYEEGETINYGLSLGKSSTIDIIKDKYKNISEEEFLSIMKAMGLDPYHDADKDEYNEEIPEGYIAFHGSGSYESQEKIRYGLSKRIIIQQYQYRNIAESEFIKNAEKLGLLATHDAARDGYSDQIPAGYILTHGYGSYVKNEKFNYGLSLGEESAEGKIRVTAGYEGKTESEFRNYINGLGLVPVKSSEEYSDKFSKGTIISYITGVYNQGNSVSYVLSLGKKEAGTDIIVSAGQYTGKTVTEFENTTRALGLDPYHDPSKDDYSDTITQGLIVWHGSGTYVTNERIRYGLSLGSNNSDGNIQVVSGYEGKTETEFRNYINSLGLVPVKGSEEYSDKYSKGTIISYITGSYKKGNSVSYVLSLGTNQSSSDIVIDYGKYTGKTVTEFENTMKALGLDPYHDPSKDDYSDTIAQGLIVWHGSGTYVTNEKIRYGLSLGKKEEPETTAVMISLSDLKSRVLSTGDYEAAVNKMKSYLDGQGFNNYTITGSTSKDYGAGVLLSVNVNNQEHISRAEYPIDAKIIVTICTGYEGG